ncbi:MAG: MMPL family transporter [Methylacidiphilales bacterium]|nr:MMPL family transporter [Candidatus Methylacidiphilales bacterium]
MRLINTALPYFKETPKFQLFMSLIHRVLQWIMGQVARVVCARPALILAIGILFALGSIFVVWKRFNVINNTTDLLSDKFEPKRNYKELVHDFGSDYRFIVLIQSNDPAQNRQVADEVGQYLLTLKPQISAVLCKIDFSALKQRLLFTRNLDELQKIADQLKSQLNLQKKSQAQSEQMALDLNSILDEANRKFDEKYLRKKENWTEFKPFVRQFVSILNKVTEQASGKKLPQAEYKASDDTAFGDLDATEMLAEHEYFSLQDGQSVLVFAYTGEDEKDSDAPFSQTTGRIREKLRQIEMEHPGVQVKLTGEPALDTDEMLMTKIDTTKASCITLALIIALFFLSYRTFLRPAFTFLTLIMAVLWSLGFALVIVGHFNILSIAVIPMVLGIGIDFGIQILGRYEEELGHGRTISEAVTVALQHTGVAIITGGSTTAAAFFSLCFNDFVGLAELGIIAGASMVLCITANLVVLPAIFILRDRNRTPEQLQTQSNDSAWHFIHTWDRDMVRHPWFWIVLSAVISVISILSLPYLKFDYNLLHLDNPSAESVKTLYQVMNASRNDQGAEVSTIYASVVADNLDQARDLAKKLAALPVVGKVDSLLDLVPENQDVKMPVIQQIVATASALNLKPPTNNNVDIPRARRDIESLLSQAKEALKQAKGFVGVSKIAKDAVAAFSEMVPALDRADKALNSAPVATIQQRFSASSSGAFTTMQKNMELLRIQKADRGLTLADVPPQLQKLFLAPNGKVLLQIYGKKDLWERAPDEEFVNQVLAVAPKATGTPVLNYYATELLRVSYLWAAVWAFATIVVLILLHFQSLKYLLLTLTPLVLAVLWRTGAMVWLNIQFNPANIVTLPLIIGIDVAFGVYIIDRYREDGKLSIFSGSTGKAIIMSSLTSLFGFSSLLVSTFRGMFDIGQLMSLGIAIGLVTAIFILPQILALLKPRVNNGAKS